MRVYFGAICSVPLVGDEGREAERGSAGVELERMLFNEERGGKRPAAGQAVRLLLVRWCPEAPVQIAGWGGQRAGTTPWGRRVDGSDFGVKQ